MQSVHGQVLDSESVLVHLEELPRVDPEHGLADLTKAPKHNRATAVANADREVVGGHAVLGHPHAGLTVVAYT